MRQNSTTRNRRMNNTRNTNSNPVIMRVIRHRGSTRARRKSQRSYRHTKRTRHLNSKRRRRTLMKQINDKQLQGHTDHKRGGSLLIHYPTHTPTRAYRPEMTIPRRHRTIHFGHKPMRNRSSSSSRVPYSTWNLSTNRNHPVIRES